MKRGGRDSIALRPAWTSSAIETPLRHRGAFVPIAFPIELGARHFKPRLGRRLELAPLPKET